MKDEKNPALIFQSTDTELLCAIVNGTVNPVIRAKVELANRGLNTDGAWIGVYAARKAHGLED